MKPGREDAGVSDKESDEGKAIQDNFIVKTFCKLLTNLTLHTLIVNKIT